jgi:Pyruvate/2-oxoacid:ferredoxin oxidoreductase delta subunit
MDFLYFSEGPLLWCAILLFGIGIILRVIFFLYAIKGGSKYEHFRLKHLLLSFGRYFFPLHKAIRIRPLYTSLRYIFHACMIITPIWYSGHINLWEESRFGWTWTALPDQVVDWMTLLVLGILAYFLVRRFYLKNVRVTSFPSDYFLIVLTALPFLSGYFLSHGTLTSIPFMADNMRIIHVLSGEALLIVAVFLFFRSRIIEEKCTGCAACETNCLTETIQSKDKGDYRTFTYAHHRCIGCGACSSTCPENAVEFGHEIGLGKFFHLIPKREIRTVQLAVCKGCGARFAPILQIGKIGEVIGEEYIELCHSCKGTNFANPFREKMPWFKKN